MGDVLDGFWTNIEDQLRAWVQRLLSRYKCPHSIDPDEILNETYLHAQEHLDRPDDPCHLKPWLMNAVRWRTLDRLRKLDPSISIHAQDDHDPTLDPTDRPERLALSPESEQTVRQGFSRIREHEGITPRDWTIFYLFQLRHLVEHHPETAGFVKEMDAEEVMQHFNTQG
ncbi:MAG: sigma factor [Gemmataceae bacterium]